MGIVLFKNLIKYIHFIPNSILNFFLLNKHKFIKSEILFDTIEYKLEYKNDNLSFFFLPLLINIFQISNDIQQLINKKKVISIISILVFHEKNKTEYIHSLSDSNKLYDFENFNKWPINILLNLIEKLELYDSFKKISLSIKVKIITSI